MSTRTKGYAWIVSVPSRLVLVLAMAAVLAGCGNGTKVSGKACPERDSNAKLVTIHQQGSQISVDPPRIDLSKGNKDALQWHNETDQEVVILFPGDPVGLRLPAGCFSFPQGVNQDAPNGVYPYNVTREAGGPPNPPEVSVGD